VRTPRRASLAVVVASVAFVAAAWWPAQPSSADCVPPTLSVSPSQGLPGTPVTISGKNWYLGCYDPSSPAATYQGAPPPRPDTDVSVTFSDGRTVFDVARVTPAGDGSFSFQAQVPNAAQPTNDGSFRAEGTNGSPTAGFAVGAKTPPPTTPTTQAAHGTTGTTAVTRASTATTASRSIPTSPTLPNALTTSSVVFNPSTPLAPQGGVAPRATGLVPPVALPQVRTPPVTLGSSGHSRGGDLVWVVGFLVLGLAAGVAYFIYQRNPQWSPRRF
jgi:hypothetical protein